MDYDLAKLRYSQQKAQAKNRLDKNGDPILWKLSFEEWCDIWIQSGKWDQRGRGGNNYCMSRCNDIGHYEVSNVIIITNSQNVKEGQLGRKFPQKGRTGPRAPHSLERKQKIGLSNKGNIPWNKGTKGLQVAWNKGLRRLKEQGDQLCV